MLNKSYAEALLSMKARRQRQLAPAFRSEALAPKAAQVGRVTCVLHCSASGPRALAFVRALADPGRPYKIAAENGAGVFFGSQGQQP
jgi:hypothetical protein